MKIEHVALYVQDLEVGAQFFEIYFGGRRNTRYHNEKTGFSSYFISFEDSTRLEVMQMPGMAGGPDPSCCGYAHVAFKAGSKEQVDAITARLREDGYTISSGPRTTGDGYYESCVAGPESNMVEITV